MGNEEEEWKPSKSKSKSLFVPCVANFSVQYNLQSIAIALVIMDPVYPNDKNSGHGWITSVASSVVFAGCVCGQLVLGLLGDVLGRDKAMILTLSLIAVGALLSAVASWGSIDTVYIVICAARFLMGMGVGGVYPLSATKASEETAEGEDSTLRVSWSFFWQTPGAMAPFAMALLVYLLVDDPSARFRWVLGLGAVPAAAIVLIELCKTKEEPTGPPPAVVSSAELWAGLQEKEHWVTLAGTGGTWFLYDFCYYGTALFSPKIVKKIWGDGGDVVSVSWQNIVANAMGIPGLLLAIWLLRRLGTKNLQVYGFVLIAGMFLVLGVLWETCPDNHILLFVAYCFLQFSLNWGPNLSTFVLPSEVYPPGVRSSFNGASAALGKIGALVGGFTFQPIYDQFGMFAVMATCAVISLVGALVTHLCIENDMAREQRKSFNKPGYRPGPPQKAENAEHLLA